MSTHMLVLNIVKAIYYLQGIKSPFSIILPEDLEKARAVEFAAKNASTQGVPVPEKAVTDANNLFHTYLNPQCVEPQPVEN